MRVSHICGNIKLGKKASRAHFGCSTVILSDVNRLSMTAQKWVSQIKMSRRRSSLWCPRPTVNLLRKSQFLTSWTHLCFFMTCTPSAVCLHTSLYMKAAKWSPQNLILDGAKLFLRRQSSLNGSSHKDSLRFRQIYCSSVQDADRSWFLGLQHHRIHAYTCMIHAHTCMGIYICIHACASHVCVYH